MGEAVLRQTAEPDNPNKSVVAVDRALSVLAAVSAEAEPVSLARLAERTGLYKSTILRLIESLKVAGYVQRLDDGRYALGPAAFRLGVAYERGNPLRHHVLAALRDLVASGSESASFHIASEPGSRTCLFRIDSAHATLDRIRAGDKLPLDRGAAGRVLLAFTGKQGKSFDEVRENCFAFSVGEREAGCSGMAAPVFAADGTLAGALSLSGPSDRFSRGVVALWRPRLVAAAADITRALGGQYPAQAV